MSITAWWKARIGRRDRRRGDRARLRDAHRYGRRLARQWLAGRGSVVRALTPGAEGSFVAAAFRHGLVEGTSTRDAVEVAQAVLSGMADAARKRSRQPRAGKPSLEASRRVAAQRGVAWMAEQVLRGVDADFELGQATIEKIRGWSLGQPLRTQGPSPTQRPSPLSASRG
jgi:hypothetical protein